jgi:lipopolysaccharide transport system permease protein
MLQIWFYATPIVYPLTLVPENLRPFYYLNPMVGIIQSYRSVMLEGDRSHS